MKKHFQYLRYVLRHKYFVFVAGLKLGASWWLLLTHDLSKFRLSEWRAYAEHFYGEPKVGEEVLVTADNYGARAIMLDIRDGDIPYYIERDDKQRFWAYKAEVHRTEPRLAEDFDQAWLHHQKRNAHHWQYWMLVKDNASVELIPMPEKYIQEMVADWMGAGRAITGKWEAKQWYLDHQYEMVMHAATRMRVEDLLGL